MFETFYQILAGLKNSNEVKEFLTDLLTPTEQVMLAKRLSIAILLTYECDYRTISEILKVSYATIGNVAKWLKLAGRGYREALRAFIKEHKPSVLIDLVPPPRLQ